MCARQVQLLGPVQVVDDVDKVPRFRSQRTMALLGYLVTERRAVARDALAALLFPDESSSKGRGSLRRELHNLGQILPGCWEIDRRSVRFLPLPTTDIDLLTLLTLTQAERWASAGRLINGEFLEGVTVEENAELEDWLLGERRRWRQRCTTILARWADQLGEQRQYEAAIDVIERLLRLDPLQEASYRQLMQFHALSGDFVAVQRAYARCVSVLDSELDVAPSHTTVTLAERLAGQAKTAADTIQVSGVQTNREPAKLPLACRSVFEQTNSTLFGWRWTPTVLGLLDMPKTEPTMSFIIHMHLPAPCRFPSGRDPLDHTGDGGQGFSLEDRLATERPLNVHSH